MDALEVLKQQHIEAHAAFARIKAAGAADRATEWTALQPQLEMHEQIEEAFVYDPVAEDASEDPVLAGWEDEHEAQVAEANEVIARIDALDPADDQWLQLVTTLGATLDTHIAHEEQDIWPRIRKAWPQAKLDQAGAKMAAVKTAVEHGATIEDAVATQSKPD
jgi:hemerythrin-like domain-containing protein